jgi:hypothetical protein
MDRPPRQGHRNGHGGAGNPSPGQTHRPGAPRAAQREPRRRGTPRARAGGRQEDAGDGQGQRAREPPRRRVHRDGAGADARERVRRGQQVGHRGLEGSRSCQGQGPPGPEHHAARGSQIPRAPPRRSPSARQAGDLPLRSAGRQGGTGPRLLDARQHAQPEGVGERVRRSLHEGPGDRTRLRRSLRRGQRAQHAHVPRARLRAGAEMAQPGARRVQGRGLRRAPGDDHGQPELRLRASRPAAAGRPFQPGCRGDLCQDGHACAAGETSFASSPTAPRRRGTWKPPRSC